MKMKFFLLMVLLSSFVISCKDECDPGVPPVDEILYVSILNNNGSSFIKYVGNIIPDSVKVTNLNTGALVTRNMIKDSILSIETYDKSNGGITSFKISKGTILKPDTIQITSTRRAETDKCGGGWDVARFSQIKVNGVIKCNNTCVYNSVATIQR
jgi:hypothetical protein